MNENPKREERYCPICDENTEMTPCEDMANACGVSYLMKYYHCSACGEGWVDPEQGKQNDKAFLKARINDVAKILQEAWLKAEPDHEITNFPCSYIATFVDMARAVCNSEHFPLIANQVFEDALRYRFLADNACDIIMSASTTDYGDGDNKMGPRVSVEPDQYPVKEYGSAKEKLDAAIDALRETC